jgi:hypothetical protein
MLSRSYGTLRRLQAMLVGLGLLTIVSPTLGHEGHDHGTPPASEVTTSNPRVSAQSDAYELVGVLRGGRLRVYLDRFSSNEPVTDAKLTVTVGSDEEVLAEKAADDTYTVASGKFAGESPLDKSIASAGTKNARAIVQDAGKTATVPLQPAEPNRLVGALAARSEGTCGSSCPPPRPTATPSRPASSTTEPTKGGPL